MHHSNSNSQYKMQAPSALTSSLCLAPLQACMLPHLTAGAVAALRSTCRAMRHLVDQGPVEHLRSAMQAVLPSGLTAYATSSLQLQAMVQAQAEVAVNLQACFIVKLQPIFVPAGAVNVKASWSSEWPATKLLLRNFEDGIRPYTMLIEDLGEALELEESTMVLPGRGEAEEWSAVCFADGGVLMAFLDLTSHPVMPPLKSLGIWDFQHGSLSCPSSSWQETTRTYHLLTASTCLPVILLQEKTLSSSGFTLSGITAVSRSSLQEVYTLQPPDLRTSALQKLNVQAACMLLSPGDQYLAIMWCDHRAGHFTAHAMRLDIYMVADGRRVATFDARTALAFRPQNHQNTSPPFDEIWSPTERKLLLCAHHHVEMHSHVAIFGVDGALCRLQIPVLSVSQLSWSPDGMYVSLVSVDSRRGLLIDATAGEVMLSWPLEDSFRRMLVWAPACACFFSRAWKVLVGLPSPGIRDSVEFQPLSSVLALKNGAGWPNVAFAPNGKFLVAAGEKPSIRASHVSSQFDGLVDELAKAHQLCHIDCNLAHHSMRVVMTRAAMGRFAWQVQDIAWHPGPTTSHIYAIANLKNQVHLMDAKQHCCLGTWPDNVPNDEDDDEDMVCRLVWSPDGSQLLVAENSRFNLLTFGLQAFGSQSS